MRKKTKPFTITIDEEVNLGIREIAVTQNTSFSDIAEKSLRYCLYHQKDVLKFSQDVNESRKERLRFLEEKGISERKDLCFLTELIQQAYAVTPGVVDVTPEFVINLTKAFQILLKLKIKNRNELMPYFLSIFPGQELEMNDLERRIDLFLEFVNKKTKIDSVSADYVAKCLLGLLRDGIFEIPLHIMRCIENLLTPWIFWVATKTLNHDDDEIEFLDLPLDPASLIIAGGKYFKRNYHIANSSTFGPVTADIFSLSERIFSHFKFFDNTGEVKCEISCNVVELFDLFLVINILESHKMLEQTQESYAVTKQWEIGKNSDKEKYSICRHVLDTEGRISNTITIHVSKNELDGLVQVVKKIVTRKDINIALQLEHAKRYGVI